MFVFVFSHKFHPKKFLNEINLLFNKTVFGIRFALNLIREESTYIVVDKAKPRAIVGRKATPACRNAIQHAGVPLSRNAYLPFAGTTACRHGSHWDSRVAERELKEPGCRG